MTRQLNYKYFDYALVLILLIMLGTITYRVFTVEEQIPLPCVFDEAE